VVWFPLCFHFFSSNLFMRMTFSISLANPPPPVPPGTPATAAFLNSYFEKCPLAPSHRHTTSHPSHGAFPSLPQHHSYTLPTFSARSAFVDLLLLVPTLFTLFFFPIATFNPSFPSSPGGTRTFFPHSRPAQVSFAKRRLPALFSQQIAPPSPSPPF